MLTEKRVKVALNTETYFDEDGIVFEVSGAGHSQTVHFTWEELLDEAMLDYRYPGYTVEEGNIRRQTLWISDQLRLLADRIRAEVTGVPTR